VSAQPAAAVLERKINIVQGEFHVTVDADLYLTTILGSCVAACLTDPVARVGGMNHFLLPGDEQAGSISMSHGVHAMELLMNGLLQRGARRERLQAKLFGGARMLEGLTDVGRCNADFAERFIKRERIMLTGGSLRGDRGRRVQFWPVSGRVRALTLGSTDATVFKSERLVAAPKPDLGGVELF
jgi:chemotaxis protein CheD